MSGWFTETWSRGIRFSVEYSEMTYAEETPFQKIAFYRSDALGRFFSIDGVMMASEKDEYVYHEMIVHVPLSVRPQIRDVLVIGGGDGGTVRELTRYASIRSIDLVEIDRRVVDLCRVYFPVTTTGLDDARVSMIFTDGAKYVAGTKKKYDLVIVDSTDPIGPGEGLFTAAFYRDCLRILNPDGILVNQHESPYFLETRREMARAHAKLKAIFPIARVYQAFIPTYPSGHWLFGFAAKAADPLCDFVSGVQAAAGIATRYYNEDVHRAAFALPNDVLSALAEASPRP